MRASKSVPWFVSPASSRGRAGGRWFLPVVALLAATGCKLKDAEQCNQARQVVRQAISAGRFDAVQPWRDFAYKQCDDSEGLAALDRELVAARAKVQTDKRAAETKRQANRDLIKVFLTWVAENRQTPERAAATPVCDELPEGSPKDSKERLCTATRKAGGRDLVARYYEAESRIARFTMNVPEPTSCTEIGAGAAQKTWQIPAAGGKTAERTRCEFSSGALSGLVAVVSQAGEAPLYVVSADYVSKDPGWRAILEGP